MILLLSVIAANFSFVGRQEAEQASVQRSLEVQLRLSRVLSLLQDAETGQRGFLLTHSEAYLEPYSAALPAIDSEIEALRQFVDENNPLSALCAASTAAMGAGRHHLAARWRCDGEPADAPEYVIAAFPTPAVDARAWVSESEGCTRRSFLATDRGRGEFQLNAGMQKGPHASLDAVLAEIERRTRSISGRDLMPATKTSAAAPL